MQAVRIAIFNLVNYLIENRCAVLPSSATALLYEEPTPRPMPRPPAVVIQNLSKEAGQFTVQVVSFVIFLSGQLFNLNCRADLPTSATALLFELHTLRPTPRPPTASIQKPPTEAGQLTVQVVSCANFYFLPLFNLICPS